MLTVKNVINLIGVCLAVHLTHVMQWWIQGVALVSTLPSFEKCTYQIKSNKWTYESKDRVQWVAEC